VEKVGVLVSAEPKGENSRAYPRINLERRGKGLKKKSVASGSALEGSARKRGSIHIPLRGYGKVDGKGLALTEGGVEGCVHLSGRTTSPPNLLNSGGGMERKGRGTATSWGDNPERDIFCRTRVKRGNSPSGVVEAK